MADNWFIISNTERGWAEDGWKIMQAEESHITVATYLEYRSTVRAADGNEEESEATDVVLNLQYFFPYCDQFLSQGIDREIDLIVFCQNSGDRVRTCCYLQGQEACHMGLKIYVPVEGGLEKLTGAPLPKEWLKDYAVEKNRLTSQTIGALCPLLRIGEPLKNKKDQIVCRAISHANLADSSGYYAQIIDSFIAATEKSKGDKGKEEEKNQPQQRPRAKNEEQDVQLQLLIDAGKEELLKISEELTGTRQEKMPAGMKEELCGQLWKYIGPTLRRLPLLTQVFWLYSLRYLNRQKEIMTVEDNKPIFHEGPVDLALWDAIAYGEGILQLLENCEQHAQHKAGYFTLNFHYVALHQNKGIVEAAIRREKISRRYRVQKGESFLGDDEKFYLEFNITDMAVDGSGAPKGIPVQAKKSLHQLFFGEKVSIKNKDTVIHHYGMPLFHKTVCLNQGRFLCTTPVEVNKIAWYSSAAKPQEQKTTQSSQVWTSYRILLPVSYRKNTDQPIVPVPKAQPLLDPVFLSYDIQPSRYVHRYLERPDIETKQQGKRNQDAGNRVDAAQKKIERVKKVEAWLKQKIDRVEANRTVYLLDMRKLDLIAFEIFTKGLFSYFAGQYQSHQPDGSDRVEKKPFLFRILFRDEFSLCEFLRRAAIIYGSSGQNEWMGGVQIALCVALDMRSDGTVQSTLDLEQHLVKNWQIRLVLAGQGLKAAYNTAKLFAQYNQSGKHNLILQIRYLTRTIGSQESSQIAEEEGAQAQFPFDLVWQEGKSSQFLEQMEQCLNRELQGEELGCKLPNAHVRIGSKIHLKDFYEAELLFQNIGYTYRFAYLIAEDIIRQLKQRRDTRGSCSKLVLVGYENYSSVLVSQVIDYLRGAGDEEMPELYHLQYFRKKNGEEYLDELGDPFQPEEACASIFILPVGTTLSTIYKLQNALNRSYPNMERNGIAPLQSYALIVVDDSSKEPKSSRYWNKSEDKSSTAKYLLQLKPEQKMRPPLSVCTFLMPSTEWMVPHECPECALDPRKLGVRIPLAQVDKTSTIPNLIFPLKRKGTKGITFSIKDQEDNQKRLEAMKEYVTYGHVSQSHNHFQFYIEYSRYYAAQRNQSDYKEWLGSLRKEVDMNSFNIVISPRSHNDCLFVKDIVDNVFLHNPYFLFLPLDAVCREDIRTKFSYITQEYVAACAGDFPPRINVYFVDYTLVSGQALHRGGNLVNMLLRDNRVKLRNNINLYHKIILLTNRSSYDTIGYIVRDPMKDFHAYVTLAVPSFNTQQNYCPTCEMVELYREISKCCATNDLYWYYRELEQKHMLRTPEEYVAWSEHAHWSRSNYLRCLCQWLYSRDQKGADQEAIKSLCEALKNWEERQNGNSSKRLEKIWDLCLFDLYENDSNSPVVGKALNALLEERTWRRMICTHKAMELQEKLAAKGWPENGVYKGLQTHLYQALEEQKTFFARREWLISYLKIISRGYLAKLAPIRQGIYTLLELLLLEMVQPKAMSDVLESCWKAFGEEEENSKWRKQMRELLCINEKMGPEELLQLYQLYLVIARRLCDLQSNILLNYEILKSIDGFLTHLLEAREKVNDCIELEKKELAQMITLPSKEQMQIDYMRLVKWGAMSSAEESKGFQLQKLAKQLAENNPEEPSDEESKGFQLQKLAKQLAENNPEEPSDSVLNCRELAEIIRIENTRLLYTGVKRLDEICQPEEDWTATLDKVKLAKSQCTEDQCAEGSSKRESNQRYYPQNPLSDLFRFLDGTFQSGDDYTLQLTAMLGLYRQIRQMNKDGSVLESKKNYIAMYGELCFYMSKIAACENCCIVHRRSGQNQIIASSITLSSDDEAVSMVNRMIGYTFAMQKDKCIEKFKNIKVIEAIPGEDGSSKGNGLVVTLRLQRRTGEKYRQYIYLVFWNRTEKAGQLCTDGISQLLFMRQPLQELLERDLYALHHFKVSYEDVAPIAPKPELCILHLTDLHVSERNVDSILQLVQDWKEELAKDEPDLVLITGDIVQGNNTAIDLERNYREAGKVIKEIARVLWSQKRPDEELVLRADWKKRIIIIPGNHDYAAMNELTATHTLRATNGGTPVMKDGSPMSRFSYFIQFLQDFLGIDMAQSVQNNLNEVRIYPQLGVRIIALNSVSQVGPLRNNKMQLDADFIQRLCQDGGGKDCQSDFTNIVLSHHTSCYEPDYIADQYYECGISEEQITQGEYCIKKCSEWRDKLYGPHKDRDEQKILELEKEGTKEVEALREKEGFKNLKKKHGSSTLYSDIDYLMCNWSILTNERCQQIIADYRRHMLMSERDRTEYRRQLGKLKKIYPYQIMLGGHTHAAGRADWNSNGMESICVEGPRFYFESVDPAVIRFGRLYIEKEHKYKYVFSPKPEYKPLKAPDEG